MAKSSFAGIDDGINLRETFNRNEAQERSMRQPQPRPEMKGPSDISDILSGLKTKTINIQEQNPSFSQNNTNNTNNINDNSTISISDLKELQGDGNMPKRSRRKKSNSNTVSLDI
jgi:hypothetical protein